MGRICRRADRTRAGQTVEVPAADDCPDSVFVEDTVVMVGDTAVLSRPGADQRKPEIDGTAVTLTALGYPRRADHRRHAGRRRRAQGRHDASTSGAPCGPARPVSPSSARICEPLGFTVIAVPVTKVLHLKSAVTALPDGTIIGYPPLVDDPAFWPHFRPMPEESGSHVVDLGEGRLLMASSAPRSAELIADLGYTPVTGGHLRVREARGLRHLPVRPAAVRAADLRR